MDVLQMPVTLIVKAPNQKIQDQTVECELSWTIEKLKGYLSEVYPSKPRTEDQKLIYSGQLLPDHLKLRDVLRLYEDHNTHTVHLVCASSRDLVWPVASQNSSHACSGQSSQMPPSQSVDSVNMNGNSQSDNDNSGLRHRVNISGHNYLGFSSYFPGYTYGQQMTVPGITTQLSQEQLMQQMAVMHQMYAQYMQYMQMGEFPQEIPEVFVPPQQTVGLQATPDTGNQEDPLTPAPPPVAVANQDAVPPVAPVNEEIRMNAQGGAFMEEEDNNRRGNRDWLDWFYTISRLLVLFSVVYYYSSLVRFLMVAGLGMMMYLYQIGFFRLQRRPVENPENQQNTNEGNNRVIEESRREVPSPANDTATATQGENQPAEGNVTTAGETNEASPDVSPESSEQVTSTSTAEQTQRPSALTVTWTFFSSFISSMIPEQPTLN